VISDDLHLMAYGVKRIVINYDYTSNAKAKYIDLDVKPINFGLGLDPIQNLILF